MTDTRIVLIDGLPGSGKTTLTNWLSTILESNKIENDAYEELCRNHPLRINDPLYTDLTSADQSEEFRSRTIDLFKEFVERKSKEDTISIFDSLLFQNIIGWAFLCRMHLNDSTDFAFRLIEILMKLDPVLIYIAQTDVEQNWRRTCRIRGAQWTKDKCGFSKDFDYVKAGIAWSANQKYCLSIIDKSRLDALVIMNSDYDFDAHKSRIVHHLKLNTR
jgi:thymidylate kinase